MTICPWVTAAIGRSGATSGTREKSNGLATSAVAETGRSAAGALGQQREDPAEAPADELHGAPARVVRHGPHGARDHVVEPVLEPERAVAEAHGPVVDEVGRVAAAEEVLGHGAAAAQVEAERRRGERRHEQHGSPSRGRAPR